jgi:hypothetical protein
MKRILSALGVVGVMAAAVPASPVDMMIGARGFGMGGAYVALATDASASYWNPAGLGSLSGITLMESNWILPDIEGLNVNYAALAVPVKYLGTISVSWLYLYASLEQLDINGDIETNKAGEHAFSLSWGRRLWEKLLIFQNTSIGLTINRYAFLTEVEDAAGLGFDIGARTEFPYGFSLGVTGRTLGAEVMGARIDPELRFGLAWSKVLADMHRPSVTVDGSYKRNRDYAELGSLEPAGNNMRVYAGLEYALLISDFEVALRGGFNAPLHSTLESYGFAFGAGFRFLGYELQYAFKGDTKAEAALGYSHRIDLLINFMKLTKNAVEKTMENDQ